MGAGVWTVPGMAGPRQDEILSEMRHGLVQTNYRMSVKITSPLFSHTILSGLEQDNLQLTSQLTSQLNYKEKESSLYINVTALCSALVL